MIADICGNPCNLEGISIVVTLAADRVRFNSLITNHWTGLTTVASLGGGFWGYSPESGALSPESLTGCIQGHIYLKASAAFFRCHPQAEGTLRLCAQWQKGIPCHLPSTLTSHSSYWHRGVGVGKMQKLALIRTGPISHPDSGLICAAGCQRCPGTYRSQLHHRLSISWPMSAAPNK